jgi:hypothetical protein
MGEAQAEAVEAKKMLCGAVKGGNRSIDKIYTPAFRARAGLLKCISFFIRLIGFKGLSIYNTVVRELI